MAALATVGSFLVRAGHRLFGALVRLRARLGALGDASHELRHDERIAELRLRQQHPYY